MFERENIREAAVSGAFYPSDPNALAEWVAKQDCSRESAPGRIRAWIAPHAGYVYSGQLAAATYAGVDRADRVWLLGPSHHVYLSHPVTSDHTAWRTPLGDAVVDTETVSALVSAGRLGVDADAHAPEHALETQLPFLQGKLPGVPFVPILTASTDSDRLADMLKSCWRDGDVLAVSSDLSHFLTDGAARTRDAQTAAAIESGDLAAVVGDGACGWVAVRTLMRLAAAFGWKMKRVGLMNSAAVSGDRQRVVGYGGWWFYEAEVRDDG